MNRSAQKIIIESQYSISISDSEERPKTYVTFSNVYVSHRHKGGCTLCGKPVKKGRTPQMSQGAKLQLLVSAGIFVPEGAKCCLDHLDVESKLIKEGYQVDRTRFNEELSLDNEETNVLYKTLVNGVLQAQKKRRPLDFDTPGKF